MNRIDSLKIKNLELQLIDAETYTYDIVIDVVDDASSETSVVTGRRDRLGSNGKEIHCEVPQHCLESRGDSTAVIFNAFSASEALSVILEEEQEASEAQLAAREKARIVIRDTDFPPPGRGRGMSQSSVVIKSLLLSRESNNQYSLQAFDTEDKELYPMKKINQQSGDSNHIICFTHDQRNGESCASINFDDGNTWNIEEGIAFFVDNTAGDTINKEEKQGVMLIKN